MLTFWLSFLVLGFVFSRSALQQALRVICFVHKCANSLMVAFLKCRTKCLHNVINTLVYFVYLFFVSLVFFVCLDSSSSCVCTPFKCSSCHLRKSLISVEGNLKLQHNKNFVCECHPLGVRLTNGQQIRSLIAILC